MKANEGVAALLLGAAGWPTSIIQLAERLIAPGCVREVDASYPLPPSGAEAIIKRGRFYIVTRSALRRDERDFLVAHEVAEWLFYGRNDDQVEDDCDALAEELLRQLSQRAAVA